MWKTVSVTMLVSWEHDYVSRPAKCRLTYTLTDSNLPRVGRPADYEAFIRSHVYKPEYRKSVFTNRKRTIPIGQPPRRHRVFPDRE